MSVWADVARVTSIGVAATIVALDARSGKRLHNLESQIATAARADGGKNSPPARAAPSSSSSTTAEPEWLTGVREQLPLTEQLIYMQTGGHGPALDSVLSAAAEAAADDAHVGMEVMTGVRPQFFKAAGLGSGASGVAAAEARQALGALLGCDPDSVAVLSSTSVALYTVIMARQWEQGDELIISNLEHVCIASITQGLEAQYGVKITAIPAGQGDEACLAALAAALTPRTRLVVLSHVASPTGHVLPVAVSHRTSIPHTAACHLNLTTPLPRPEQPPPPPTPHTHSKCHAR
jgi:kynureninase